LVSPRAICCAVSAVQQSGSPAVRQSGSPAVRQSGSPAVWQYELVAEAKRMPPVAVSVLDPLGTKVIDDWISSLTASP
jgi:hypothetical protein